MKLNLAIISEYLEKHIAYAHVSENQDLTISKVGLSGFDDEETVFLVENDQFRNRSIYPEYGCFAIVGEKPDVTLPEGCEYIIFQNMIDYGTAFVLLQDALLYFQNWEKTIYKAMADHQKIAEVIKLCTIPLRNPIALFDPSFVLVATGGAFQSDDRDQTWSQVMKHGYFPISAHEKNGENRLWSSQKPICVRTEDTVKASVCLRYHGKIIGYLGSTEANVPFTGGQLSLLHGIQKILESGSYLSTAALSPERKISTLLTRLLLGYHVENSVVTYYLNSISWSGKHRYELMLVTNITGTEFPEEELSPTMRTLKAIFPNSLTLSLEECIAIIIKENAHEDSDRRNLPLMTVLQKRNLAGFRSMTFSDFSYLRPAYLQCRMLISHMQNQCRPQIYAFESYYQDCVVSALADSTSIRALCDPGILAISVRKNGPDFIHSLRIYLIHGQNCSDAARELKIHRNTLIYRIEQIEKLLGVTLHDESEEKLFRFYMTCIFLEKKLL